jgi:hypothetical protein
VAPLTTRKEVRMDTALRICTVLALPVTAILAGCDTNGRGFSLGSLTGSDRVAFRCDDERVFRVSYNDDGNEAVVDAGDASYRLELRDRDGSRREYEGERVDLTVDGDEASLRISGDDDYTDCEQI